jgi:hypothetical protein
VKRLAFATITILFLAVPPCGWSQTPVYGTATVGIGNTWTGVNVPGGLWSDGVNIFTGMTQQATVAPFCPSWISLWGGTTLSDGTPVNWTVDVPQGPGHYHLVYSGTMHVTWNWFFMSYMTSVSYGVTVSYVQGG